MSQGTITLFPYLMTLKAAAAQQQKRKKVCGEQEKVKTRIPLFAVDREGQPRAHTTVILGAGSTLGRNRGVVQTNREALLGWPASPFLSDQEPLAFGATNHFVRQRAQRGVRYRTFTPPKCHFDYSYRFILMCYASCQEQGCLRYRIRGRTLGRSSLDDCPISSSDPFLKPVEGRAVGGCSNIA